jgi:hypothetical protein
LLKGFLGPLALGDIQTQLDGPLDFTFGIAGRIAANEPDFSIRADDL